MNKSARSISIVAAGAIVAVAASALIRWFYESELAANGTLIIRQAAEIKELRGEQEGKKEFGINAATTADNPSEAVATSREVDQLRAESKTLKARLDLLQAQVKSSAAAGARFFVLGDYNLLEHNDILGITGAGRPRPDDGKLSDGRSFGSALSKYVAEHGGVFPETLQQVERYLPKPVEHDAASWQDLPISGTNEFELVFHGSLNDLTNIPLRRIAVLRERAPWTSRDGKAARVYGYADGMAELVASDDNFQSWEAQHIVPSGATH